MLSTCHWDCNFVQCDQYRIIAKLNLTQSSIFMWRFRCSSRRSFLHSLLIIGRRWNSRNRLRNSARGSSRRNSGGGSLGRNSRRNWPGWRIWNTWRRLGYRKDKTGPRPGYTYEPRDRAVCNGDTSLNTHNFAVKLMRLLKSMGKLMWNCSTKCLLSLRSNINPREINSRYRLPSWAKPSLKLIFNNYSIRACWIWDG